jgi:hypothetical protein
MKAPKHRFYLLEDAARKKTEAKRKSLCRLEVLKGRHSDRNSPIYLRLPTSKFHTLAGRESDP